MVRFPLIHKGIAVLAVVSAWCLYASEVETLWVTATSYSPVSCSPLESGSTYLVEVTGTFYIAGSSYPSDAEFADVSGAGGSGVWTEYYTDYGEQDDVHDLVINGVAISWLGSSDNGITWKPHTFSTSPSHVYRAYIEGKGAPVAFAIADHTPFGPNCYSDNSGGLTVTVRKGQPPRDYVFPGIDYFTIADPISPKGNFYIPVTDLACSTCGPAFELARIYNSGDTNAVPLGVGWHHAYLTHVETNGAQVTLVRQDAKRETYALTNGVYAIQGDAWSGDLTQSGEGWRFRDKANVAWLYGSDGKLGTVHDRNGNALALAWSAAGLLTNVADSAGRGVVFQYDGAGLLTNVADWAGRSVAYGYTNVGGLSCLAEVRDVRGFRTVYGYGEGGVLTTVTDANGRRTVENVYDSQRRVVSQTDAFTNRTAVVY